MAAARPLISVRKVDVDGVCGSTVLPSVFLAPIRPDIVHFVHSNMAKNSRQPYAVSAKAGMQHSAESWGTGRAVARIPRVSGGGTSRSGQGAFGNMCRKGRMFGPTKIWRKWHRKINTNQKRFAVASALAASALPSLVLARGHRVEQVPEVPLVVDNSIESVTKTKQAVSILKTVGAIADVEKAKASRKLRRGKGKMRNRRHTMRRGPLIVYNQDNGVVRAFRNLPGVEIAQVDSLNLLQLAPGGHLGRFVIWTQSAFNKLNDNWGSVTRESTQKSGYTLPRPTVTNSDITRIINSDEIQSKINAVKSVARVPRQKKNPLKNLGALVKLNPYALAARRSELQAQARRVAGKPNKVEVEAAKSAKAEAKAHDRQQKVNFNRIVSDAGIEVAAKTKDIENLVVPAAVKQQKRKRKEKVEVVAEVVEEKKDDKKSKKAAPAAAPAPAAKKK